MTLQRTDDLPLHRQLAQQLIQEIQSGVYAPGDRLPSENQLAAQYGIHRLTVRQAMNSLEEQGVVYRHQGRGSFVAEVKLDYAINASTNFRHNLIESGYLPTLRIISCQTVPATEHTAQWLKVDVKTALICIKILRSASPQMTGHTIPTTQPLCISLSYLVLQKFPDIPAQIYHSQSLHSLLRNRYSIQPYRSQTQIEAELASRDDAQLLQTSIGSPILVTRGLSQDQHSNLIEYTVSRFRGDRFTLEVSS